ncbi:ketosteroid isomerase-like protein [Nakamurella sp. UYEF19]|uniref:nuclear transport factor 2 family protein n=1 Tax=Nakamurella sp. UYEF19 TaxID=1756392 RepID=UPI0033961C8F
MSALPDGNSDPASAPGLIWAATLDIYAGFLASDRPRIDAHLHPDATFWDTDEPELISGRAELDAVRDRRPAADGGRTVTALDGVDPVIDVWGDTALARHWVTVRFSSNDVPAQSVRVTTVWRLTDGRWLAVHNHEDVRATSR